MGLKTKELRIEMATEFEDSLQIVLDKFSHIEKYYLIIHAKSYGSSFYTKFIPVKFCKASSSAMSVLRKTLGTMGYFVDNRRGILKRMWILPLDIPVTAMLGSESRPVIEIYDYARDNNLILH